MQLSHLHCLLCSEGVSNLPAPLPPRHPTAAAHAPNQFVFFIASWGFEGPCRWFSHLQNLRGLPLASKTWQDWWHEDNIRWFGFHAIGKTCIVGSPTSALQETRNRMAQCAELWLWCNFTVWVLACVLSCLMTHGGSPGNMAGQQHGAVSPTLGRLVGWWVGWLRSLHLYIDVWLQTIEDRSECILKTSLCAKCKKQKKFHYHCVLNLRF